MGTIADRIALCIDSLGVKRSEFARRLNLSGPFVSEICSGRKAPSDRTIADISREFGVNEAWLRTGEGEMFTLRDTAEEIADYTAKILVDKDAALQRRIVTFMSRIPPDCWQVLEEKAKEIFARDGEEAQE